MPRTVRRLATAVVLVVPTLASATPAAASPTDGLAASPIENATVVVPSIHSVGGLAIPNRLPLAEPGTPDLRACALQDAKQRPMRQTTSVRRRPSRMFGWLWRSTRNIDIERTGAPLLFYLRSPLLTALSERIDCPHELVEQEPDEPASCASLAVNSGSQDAYSVAIVLPQLAAGTPAQLGNAVRGRLGRGSAVTLRALGGAAIEFSPDRVRQVEARACIADA